MSMYMRLYRLSICIKGFWGKIINFPQFLLWRIKYNTFPNVRGKVYICNYGQIIIGNNVQINSNLESSQLGFLPKTILHTSRGAKIIIGNNCGLSNSTLNARKYIELMDGARLGAGVKIYDNDFHDFYKQEDDTKQEIIPSKEIIIGKNAFVGAGTIILKGVHIGDNSIIGAGSVVTKDIPSNEIWAGNPAKFIRIKEIKVIE